MNLRKLAPIALILGFAAVAAAQQPTLNCDDRSGNNRLVRHCEMREQTIPYTGQLTIDGGQNGGVSVKGSNRSDVLVRAKVEASAASDADARSLTGQIRLIASAGRVASEGPETTRDQNWSVSYEVFLPQQANVSVTTQNGGVHVSDLSGALQFSAVNGGVHLTHVNGNVQGKTTNGGLHIELAGSRWEGQGMDVSTTNGGVHLALPANYSARLETSTVNGGFHSGVPLTVSGKTGKQVSATLGSGGATIRIATTNGGVHVDQI